MNFFKKALFNIKAPELFLKCLKANKGNTTHTCIRHLLTSLAQRALLQPVDDWIHSRNRRTVTVGAVMYCDLMFPAGKQCSQVLRCHTGFQFNHKVVNFFF